MSETQPIFDASFIIFNELSQMYARFLFDISSVIWPDRNQEKNCRLWQSKCCRVTVWNEDNLYVCVCSMEINNLIISFKSQKLIEPSTSFSRNKQKSKRQLLMILPSSVLNVSVLSIIGIYRYCRIVGLNKRHEIPLQYKPYNWSNSAICVCPTTLTLNMLFCGMKKFGHSPRWTHEISNLKHAKKHINRFSGTQAKWVSFWITHNTTVFIKYKHRHDSFLVELITSLKNIFNTI